MKKLSFLVLLAAGLGFAYGLFYLFQLRFEAGDNYPEYSSLRADPLGSKALYASLDRLVETRRHFRSLARLESGPNTTLLYLGAPRESLRFTPADLKYLETFVKTGGRLVVAMFPAHQPPWRSAFPPAPGRRPGPARPAPGPPPPPTATNTPPLAAPPGFTPPAPKPPTGGPDPFEFARTVPITERWGMDFGFAPGERDPSGTYKPVGAVLKVEAPALPRELEVHSAVYFSSLDPAWRVVYARPSPTNDMPVVIERSWGRGTLVLASDAYPFSNEALRHARPAALLSWFVGPNHHVTFEEAHLGVKAEPGIAALARRYRLGSLCLALLVLAGLFVWKSSVSFLPSAEEDLARERANEVGGRDSASGLTNLLSRHLSPADLMKTCLEQWNEHVAGSHPPAPARLAAMQKLIDAENALEPARRNPIRLYREFYRILSKRQI